MPRTAAANNMADDDRVDKSKLIRIKITSLGDGGTGKSCIIKLCPPVACAVCANARLIIILKKLLN